MGSSPVTHSSTGFSGERCASDMRRGLPARRSVEHPIWPGARSTVRVTPMSEAMRRRWLDGGLDRVPVADSPGELWLCGKHVVGADPEAALERIGGRPAMVCLNQRSELEDRYPGYVAWLQEHDGGRAMWFPIPDLHAPSLSSIRPFLDRVVLRLDAGEHLLVHCGAGVGRAGTVAVCLLMLHGV